MGPCLAPERLGRACTELGGAGPLVHAEGGKLRRPGVGEAEHEESLGSLTEGYVFFSEFPALQKSPMKTKIPWARKGTGNPLEAAEA